MGGGPVVPFPSSVPGAIPWVSPQAYVTDVGSWLTEDRPAFGNGLPMLWWGIQRVPVRVVTGGLIAGF